VSEVLFLERLSLAFIFVQTGMFIEYRYSFVEKYIFEDHRKELEVELVKSN